MPTRRAFITAGGLALAGLAASRAAHAATLAGSQPVEIGMMSDTLGTSVWFDPIGVLIEPGQTVRWTVHSNVHTTMRYMKAGGDELAEWLAHSTARRPPAGANLRARTVRAA